MFISNRTRTTLITTSLVIALSILIAWYITTRGISYREGIVFGLLAAIIAVLVSGRTGLTIGLLTWIGTLGIGYRTAEVTYYLKVHPSELLLWGLLIMLILQKTNIQRRGLRAWLPRWVWLFIPFWFWGWLPGVVAGRPWDKMFAEFKNFALIIPLFILVEEVLQERQNWRTSLWVFFLTGTWIALFGVIEYLFPGIRDLFPGFVSNPTATLTNEGFMRARFSFWGTPAATFVVVLTLPMAIALWDGPAKRSLQRKILVVSATLLQLVAIYIGGYRSMWLITGMMIILTVIWRYGLIWGSMTLAPMALLYRYLPNTAQERALSAILAVEGNPIDSSAAKRWDRLSGAIQQALQHPLGQGWASVGWAHSDFAQVAANLGVIAGAIFLLAYLITLWRYWKKVYKNQSPLRFSLLLAFLAAGGILAIQGVEVLPQFFLPVVFVWVLVEIDLRTPVALKEEI